MDKLTYGFIGLGLIGGSIAKGLRKFFPECKIIAYNRSENARIMSLEDKTADIVCSDIDNNFSDCDYIFLCTPVEHNVTYLKILKSIIKKGCIITDVGSVKSNIHHAIRELDMEASFIGGHPMAGSEKTGYENSDASILENAFFALTPTSTVSEIKVNELKKIVEKLGCISVILDYEEHDYAVAAISHVPHLIAAGLVNMVHDNDSEKQTMKLLAAGGFKDITRIASSSPNMWQQICTANSKNVSDLLEKYIDILQNIKNEIDNASPDYVYNLIEKSRDYRNSFSDTHKGPITKIYDIYCDILDEFGTISAVATILADNKINIKNIGIVHNREFENGVLKIELNSEADRKKTKLILEENQYAVYIR